MLLAAPLVYTAFPAVQTPVAALQKLVFVLA